MKLFIASLLIFFTSYVSSSCDKAIDQVGFRACLSQKADNSAKEVRAKQEELLNKIKSWDQEPEFRNETIELFKKSVKSFDSYKERQCRYEWSAAAGGNGASSMGASCTIRLNKDYLNSLELQFKWYEPYL
ncbi:lysozyme inhibitor LprI family protein [Marinomonas sp. PE14-40]|uniref:lysozyme inhibitor LprI family protein n=1 Tax=Marinomonas sp. PE14-40 TaxID=3060621 RepID=UPI003F677BD2